jgi:hypothetical protein
MNLKRAATIVTTGGGLAAWLVGATTTNHVVTPPADLSARPPIERRGAELATEIGRFHDRLPPTAAPREPGRNLFKFRSTPAARPVAAAAAPAAPVPDIAAPPALPLMRLVGVSEDPGPNGPERNVFISADGQLFIAKEGDMVMTRYKVTKIAVDIVELTDIADGTVRRLALR